MFTVKRVQSSVTAVLTAVKNLSDAVEAEKSVIINAKKNILDAQSAMKEVEEILKF